MQLPSLKPYRRVADPADETRRGFRLRRRRWRAARASWVGKALALRKNAVDTALTGGEEQDNTRLLRKRLHIRITERREAES